MKMKKLSLIVFILVLSMLCAVPVCAAPSAKIVENAYSVYRRKRGVTNYKLVDIDKNGIKEMLFITSEYRIGVCSYSKAKKKVVKLASVNMGKYYPYVYYNKGKKQFALSNADTGGARYWVYKVSGAKAKRVKTLKSARQYPSFNYKFYINGKRKSQAAFERAYRKILKWKKGDLA